MICLRMIGILDFRWKQKSNFSINVECFNKIFECWRSLNPLLAITTFFHFFLIQSNIPIFFSFIIMFEMGLCTIRLLFLSQNVSIRTKPKKILLFRCQPVCQLCHCLFYPSFNQDIKNLHLIVHYARIMPTKA